MTTYSLSLREDQREELASLLHRGDGREHAAYLVCRRVHARRDPWDHEAHTKFLVTRIAPVPDDDIVESGPSIITWRTVSFVRLLREIASTGDVVAIIHSHGAGIDYFSAQDDANEPDLVQLALNRNGEGTEILSLILTADSIMRGRLWFAPRPDGHVPLRMIREVGRRIVLHYPGRNTRLSVPSLARQALAFGEAFNADLRTLRIGIIGCGGTGSGVAQLLARLGVGQLVLIDNDIVLSIDATRLVIAGDSVGGNMAAAIALLGKERKGPRFAAQVLFYPVTDASMSTGSYEEFADGPWLTRQSMAWFWDQYLPEKTKRTDIHASPLQASAEQLGGLPRTLLLIDENDVLRDEGEAYGRKLAQAGVRVTTVRYNGTIHDFMILTPLAMTPAVRGAVGQAIGYLRNVFSA